MPTYKVKAYVNVAVEIDIEGENEDDARVLFDEKITMAANLTDTDEEKFMVVEDSIWDIDEVEVNLA